MKLSNFIKWSFFVSDTISIFSSLALAIIFIISFFTPVLYVTLMMFDSMPNGWIILGLIIVSLPLNYRVKKRSLFNLTLLLLVYLGLVLASRDVLLPVLVILLIYILPFVGLCVASKQDQALYSKGRYEE